jgi:hypothetical protein
MVLKGLFWAWLRARPLLIFPARTAAIAALFAIAGIAASAAALRIAIANPIAWVVSTLAGIGGLAYLLDGIVRRTAMVRGHVFEHNLRPGDFLNAPTSLSPEYRLARPADDSEEQLYPYIDLPDSSVFIRVESGLTRAQRAELYRRWFGLCPDGFLHLEKKVNGQWRPIAVSIVLPLSVIGYSAVTAPNPAHRTSIADLDRGGILRQLDSKHRCLLIDLWIVDSRYTGAGHGKCGSSGGYANTLVMRHICTFWNPAPRGKHITILVETANVALMPVLESLTFRRRGESGIGEAFYEVSTSITAALDRQTYQRLKDRLLATQTFPVNNATASRPESWLPRR